MNGLMVAFAFSLPYHLLRTATAAGVRVHVLGSGPSRGLRTSRFCASYQKSAATGAGIADHELILEEIREVVRRRHIDVVFPSDDVSTRLLAAIRDQLPVASTPLPDLATFDLLNDKWNFTRFSLAHGVRVPQGSLYDSVSDLRRDLQSGSLAFPVTIKPINRSGGIGVINLLASKDIDRLRDVDYQPILVQQHIVGETIGISVICRSGQIVAHATQRRDDHRFRLFANPDLVHNVATLAAATGLNGPANLDAVVEQTTGLSYIVECNPRFWFTIYLSMIAGLNFFEFALPGAAPGDGRIATRTSDDIRLSNRAILRQPWKATRQDWKLLAYNYGDPLAYLAKRSRSFDDSDVAVSITQMRSAEAPTLVELHAPRPKPTIASAALVDRRCAEIDLAKAG